MTLHRLIRELQVDEWVSWKAWLQKSWQGDPGGQAMSRSTEDEEEGNLPQRRACIQQGDRRPGENREGVGTGIGVSKPRAPGALSP